MKRGIPIWCRPQDVPSSCFCGVAALVSRSNSFVSYQTLLIGGYPCSELILIRSPAGWNGVAQLLQQ